MGMMTMVTTMVNQQNATDQRNAASRNATIMQNSQDALIKEQQTQQQTQADSAAAVVARDSARQAQLAKGGSGMGLNNTILTSPSGIPATLGNSPSGGGKTILGS